MIADMSDTSPSAVIGCLLDVSASMREALEAGRQDEQAIERLQAVLRAALHVARTEYAHKLDAVMFVGVFGLKEDSLCPTVVDLCGVVGALLDLQSGSDGRSGYDLLIELADQHERAYITRYIRTKLTDDEARIVHGHLQQHPEQISEFLEAIPTEEENQNSRSLLLKAGAVVGVVGAFVITGPLSPIAAAAGAVGGSTAAAGSIATAVTGASVGAAAANRSADAIENERVDKSEALRLARDIWDDWWQAFVHFRPRPIADVIDLLERLQESSDIRGTPDVEGQNDENSELEEQPAIEQSGSTLLDTLRRYVYGRTPLQKALSKAREAFDMFVDVKNINQRMLLLISDGLWTDESPLEDARSLT